MGAKLGGGGGAVSDINVTPLIDVVLVLLIIFMVVTPMLGSDVDLQLPTAGTPKPGQDKGQHIVLNVDKNGLLYMESREIEMEELVDEVNLAFREDPARSILIRADQHLHYGQVREVMDTLGEAGMTTIQLAVDKPGGE